MGPTLDFAVVRDALPALLYGCLGTIGLALAGMGLALTIGICGVLARRSRHAALRTATIAFVEIIRNTPFLVQIFFLFFAAPTLGLRLNPTVTAIIALGLNGGPMRSRSSAVACRASHVARVRLGWLWDCAPGRCFAS